LAGTKSNCLRIGRKIDPGSPGRPRIEALLVLLKSCFRPVDLGKGHREKLLENNMKANLSIVVFVCVALFLLACGSSPQNLIVGRWEVASAKAGSVEVGSGEVGKALKMTAEFSKDGTARLTMLGQTLQGTYKLDGEHQLEWTMNGITTKSKSNVTTTELELTDTANRTVTYKRK